MKVNDPAKPAGIHKQQPDRLQAESGRALPDAVQLRSMTDGAGVSASGMIQLQRAVGNRALSRLVNTGRGAVQRKENRTGMPDALKDNLERQSGMDLSDVKVHYNSSRPAELDAHAYAQGNDIHIAPGQERHLPHEGWHVVQQRQGRVKPSGELEGGVAVNDDPALEKEADVMGAQAIQNNAAPPVTGGSSSGR